MINLETELGAWKWNFYRANKTFLQFPGLFAKLDLNEKPGSLESCSNNASCVGLELPTNRLLSYLDLDSLRKVPGSTTMVKARTDYRPISSVIGQTPYVVHLREVPV